MSNTKFIDSDRFQEKGGFALIITISLMAFLVLLLVSLTTHTRVQTEMAANAEHMAVARENAKMGLNIAIAELQKYAGLDQRTSARAEIWTGRSAPPAPTGATVPLPNVAPYLNITDFTTYVDYWEDNSSATKHRQPYWTGIWNLQAPTDVPAWLVSGNEFFDVRGSGSYPTTDPNYTYFTPDVPLDTATNNDLVTLVGHGSALGPDASNPPKRVDGHVRVQKQRIRVSKYPGLPDETVTDNPNTGHNVGHYAYAVLDEGVKASLAAAGNEIVTSPDKYDELLSKISPSRFGFEHLFNDYTVSPAVIEFDPNFQEWERVLSLEQAFAMPNPNSLSNADLRPVFHGVGAYSRGLLTDVVNGGLRKDLTALPDLVNTYQGDHFLAWNNVGSVFATGTSADPDASTNPMFRYPLAWSPITEGTDNGAAIDGIKPIVKNFRLKGEITPTGQGNPFEVTLQPELVLWNPYTGDMWNGADGYRFVVRLTYDSQPAGTPAFDLRVGAGVHWQHGSPVVNTFDSWVAANNLSLFTLQGNPVDSDGNSYLEFEIAAPFRLKAGEIAVFSGSPLIRGTTGTASTAVNYSSFNPPKPDPTATLIETIGTLYAPDFPAGLQSAPVRIQVTAVPVNGADLPQADWVDILDRDVTATLLGDITPPPPFTSDPPWRAAWTDATVNSYANTTPPDFEAGAPAVFSLGFDLDEPVTNSLTQGFVFDPRDPPGANIDLLNFYEPPTTAIPTWPTDSDHGYINVGSGVTNFSSAQDPRYMVMFDLPRIELTSVGQLRHALNPGNPPFLLGEPAPNFGDPARALNNQMWDSYFFSSLPPTPAPGSDARLNPRMEIRRYEHMTESTLYTNLDNEQLAATGLFVRGAFNVNSTSVEAWTVLLRSYANQQLSIWEPMGGSTGQVQVDTSEIHGSYGRFGQSAGLTYLGRTADPGVGDQRSIWRNGFRDLRPLDLDFDYLTGSPLYQTVWAIDPLYPTPTDDRPWDYLAEEMARLIVNDIMVQGQPFTGLADFVNSGILQNAIDTVQWRHSGSSYTGLNWFWNGTSWQQIPPTSPSYLSQGDILAALGSVLTARSDTFVVRAYGDVRNPVTGDLDARAYCEAVVQRMPEPLQPNNPANILPIEYQNASLLGGSNAMGRRFEIISFRWLSPDEI